MTVVAGLDAGTQSVKLVVYDSDARRVIASASAPLDLISGEDGSREQHPVAWVDAMRECFNAVDVGIRHRIETLGVSG